MNCFQKLLLWLLFLIPVGDLSTGARSVVSFESDIFCFNNDLLSEVTVVIVSLSLSVELVLQLWSTSSSLVSPVLQTQSLSVSILSELMVFIEGNELVLH